MARKITSKLYELIADGTLDKDLLIRACLNYMSEDDVADMAQQEQLIPEDEENEEEECCDHWHCDPDLAAHNCFNVDRSSPCPTCGELPEDDKDIEDPYHSG